MIVKLGSPHTGSAFCYQVSQRDFWCPSGFIPGAIIFFHNFFAKAKLLLSSFLSHMATCSGICAWTSYAAHCQAQSREDSISLPFGDRSPSRRPCCRHRRHLCSTLLSQATTSCPCPSTLLLHVLFLIAFYLPRSKKKAECFRNCVGAQTDQSISNVVSSGLYVPL